MNAAKGLAAAALLAVATVANAQPQTQADVSIAQVQKYDYPWGYYCRARVQSFWDDDARDARVIIQLPVGVEVNGLSASSTDGSLSAASCAAASHPVVNVDAHVLCKLGDMQVGEVATVVVRTTPPPASVTRRACSAFAWSRTPDPDLADNHAVSP